MEPISFLDVHQDGEVVSVVDDDEEGWSSDSSFNEDDLFIHEYENSLDNSFIDFVYEREHEVDNSQ